MRLRSPYANTLVTKFSTSIDDDSNNDFDDSHTVETKYLYDNKNNPSKICTKLGTCPPIHSNATKVVRDVSNYLMESSSKNSTMDVTETDGKRNNTDDGLVNGVNEYIFNRVLAPTDSHADVYNGIVASMVDEIFPSSNNEDTSNENFALFFPWGPYHCV